MLDLWELAVGLMPERLRGHLQDAAASALTTEPPDVRVLVSMRIDYVGRLAEFRSFFPTIIDNTYSIQGLSVDDARSAIVEPARLKDGPLTFASAPFEFPPTTVEQILKSAKRDTDNSIEPIILQVFCHNVEEQHLNGGGSSEAFFLQGNSQAVDAAKDQALGEYYEREVAAAALEGGVREELIREWFETELMDPTGRIRIQCAVTEELLAKSGMSKRAVQQLEKSFLIRREVRHGAEYFELVHDQLVKPIHKANENWGMRQSGIAGRALRWERSRNEKELLPKIEIERIKSLFAWPDPSDSRPPGVPMTLLERRLVYSSIAAADRETEKRRLEEHAMRLDDEKRQAESARAKAEIERATAEKREQHYRRVAQIARFCTYLLVLSVIGAIVFAKIADRARQRAGLVGYTQGMRRSREQYKGLSVSEAFEAFNTARAYLQHPGFEAHRPRTAPIELALMAAAYRQEEWKRWPQTDWPDEEATRKDEFVNRLPTDSSLGSAPVEMTAPLNNVAISPSGKRVGFSANVAKLSDDKLFVGELARCETTSGNGDELTDQCLQTVVSLSRHAVSFGEDDHREWTVPLEGLTWLSDNSLVVCARFDENTDHPSSRLIEWFWDGTNWTAQPFVSERGIANSDEQRRIVVLRGVPEDESEEGVLVTLDQPSDGGADGDSVRLWRKQAGGWFQFASQRLVSDPTGTSLNTVQTIQSRRLLAVAKHRPGRFVVAVADSTSSGHEIQIWRFLDGQFEHWGHLDSKYAITALEFAQKGDSPLLAWCDKDGRLTEVAVNLDPQSGKRLGVLRRIGRNRKPVRQLRSAEVVSGDSEDLTSTSTVWITAAQDGAIRIWEGLGSRCLFAAQNAVWTLDVHHRSPQIQFALADGRQLVTRTIRRLNEPSRKVASTSYYSAQVSRDGRYCLLGGDRGRLVLRDIQKKTDYTLPDSKRNDDETPFASEIWSTAIGGRYDERIACGSASGEIRVWNRKRLEEEKIPDSPDWTHHTKGEDGKRHSVTGLAVHPQLNAVVYSLFNGDLKLWHPEHGDTEQPLLPLGPKDLKRSAGNQEGARTSRNYLRYGLQFDEIPREDAAVYAMAFDQAGRWLVTGEKSGRILLWPWRNDSTLGLPLWVGDHDTDPVQSVAIFEDDVTREQLIVSGGGDGQVRVWRFPTEEFPAADPQVPIWDTEQIRPFKAPLAEFYINQFPASSTSADNDEPSHQIGLAIPETIIGVCITPVRTAQSSNTEPGRPVVDLLAISGRNGEVHRLTSTPLNPRFKKRDGR